jgi:signal transduction histidine kinase
MGSDRSLGRLRLRLTAWYAATFFLILAMLGGGLYLTMATQVERDLDDSLRTAADELARAARIREVEAVATNGRVVDAVDELRVPDRTLYLFDSAGNAIKPATAPSWVRDAARAATRVGELTVVHRDSGDATLRLYARRFLLDSRRLRVAVATANEVELEDRYASLFAAFVGAAVAALLLVAIGGWFLVRQSTLPVERSMEQMRRFMADAAHELRTPLTLIRTRADVSLQQERDPSHYVAALGDIAADTERLGQIVEDLLTLARVDAGERPIERESIYLDDIALDAAEAARVLAGTKDVTVVIDEFEEAPVSGDRVLLRQLVMILLDNAIKFTHRGGTVHIAVLDREGRATLSVEDDGPGIPADQLPHVFERFYRGDPARARVAGAGGTPEGAGLGLSIARWITEAHGATIALTSTFGAGTRAIITFPTASATSAS